MQNIRGEWPSASHDALPPGGAHSIRVHRLGGCFIARLTGEVDASSARDLQRHLCGIADLGHLVVDLSGVTLLDSAAVAALAAAHQRTMARGTSIHLAGARGAVLKVLEVTHLDERLDHHDDVADAVEAALTARDLQGRAPSP